MIFLRLFLSMASLFFIGYPVIHYLLLNRSLLPGYRGPGGRAFIFFVSFYTGVLFATIYLMALALASVDFSLQAVAIFSSVFCIFSVYLIVEHERKIKRSSRSTRDQGMCSRSPEIFTGPGIFSSVKLTNAIYAFIIFLITFNFLVVVFFAFLFPIRFWDAVSCWSLKGRAFFMDGSILPFFMGHDYGFAHLSYPLYIPLLQTWTYIWLGVIDETLVKVIFPVFYLSLIFLFYFAFRQRFKKLFSVLLVFVLSALPVIMDHGYIEYTNLVFSMILFLGVYYFYLYLTGMPKKTNLLVLSALFFAMLAQIRTEGMIFLLLFLIANLLITLAVHFKEHKKNSGGPVKKQRIINKIASIISPVFLSFFLMAPWLYIKGRLGISTFSSEWSLLIASIQEQNQGISGFFDFAASLKAIGAGLFYSSFDSARAFLGSSYGFIWFALIVILLINFKRSVKGYNWIFAIFILAGFVSLFFSFALIKEFIWSTDRYLLHLLPLTYFWIFYNLPLFKNKGNP